MIKKKALPILAVLYGVIVYIYTVIFFMHRNWAPANIEDYQTELDFLIQELNKNNLEVYLICILDIGLLFIICYYLYSGLKNIIRKLKTKK